MLNKLKYHRLITFFCCILLATSFFVATPNQASASVTPQIDTAPYTPTVTYTDSGGQRKYTIKNLLINDNPFILATGYGTESFESLFKRLPAAMQANIDVLAKAIREQKTNSNYTKHTGWSASIIVNGVKVESNSTENGYLGETYSMQEVSEAYNKYKHTFPADLVAKLESQSQAAKIFKVVNDSREKRDTKYHLYGGYEFVASTNKDTAKVGDSVLIQYKDNYVFVDIDVLVDLPSTCPDGSPKPANGDCGGGGGGGDIPPPCTDCGGGGGGEKTCHPSAQGSYPSCSPKPFNLTGELNKQVYPSWGTGSISWGLSKATKSASGGSATQIASTNLLPIGSGHYEARTPSYSQSGIMSGSQGKTTPKNVSASDKGTQNYSVSYDYTNHYIETYKCTKPSESQVTQTYQPPTPPPTTDAKGNSVPAETPPPEEYTVTAYDYSTCYTPLTLSSQANWQYVSERADWSKGETYSCSQSLAVDHSYGATLTGTNSASGTYNIGRSANVSAYANSCSVSSSNVYTETLTHTSAHKDLNTQTYIEFVENPVRWQGNPNYDTTTVMPFVADPTSQGNMGVPELTN